jgi:ATP-binding cassette subfamily B protein
VNKRFQNEMKQASKAKKEVVDSKVKMTLIHESFFTIFSLLITFIKIGIIIYGWLTKSITIGAIISLIALVDNAYTPIAIFNVLFVQYKLDKSAFSRYTDFLNSTNDMQLNQGRIVQKLYGEMKVRKACFPSFCHYFIFYRLSHQFVPVIHLDHLYAQNQFVLFFLLDSYLQNVLEIPFPS